MLHCPTLGLVIATLNSNYNELIWQGALQASKSRQASLIGFVGGQSDDVTHTPIVDPAGNYIYQLAGKSNVDGLIIVTSSLGLTSTEETADFCAGYGDLPLVSIGLAVDGLSSVIADPVPGMYQAFHHLAADHGCRRIAYIRGPEKNQEAMQRFAIYKQCLHDHGLSLDPDLVAQGNFVSVSRAVEDLLSRGIPDAILAANDKTAANAIDILKGRGIRVPEDVAVIGFDGDSASSQTLPALTTIRQPLVEMGRRAAHVCFDLITGKTIPQHVVLPTTLIKRRSCGCRMAEMTPREPVPVMIAQDDPDSDTGCATRAQDRAHELRLPFLASLEGRNPGAFLDSLEAHMIETASEDGHILEWQSAILSLRHQLLPGLRIDIDRLIKAEELWGQARTLIANTAVMAAESAHRRHHEVSQSIQAIGQSLSTATNIAELADALVQRLPKLDISSCHISLYAEPYDDHATDAGTHDAESRLPSQSKLILGYDPHRGRTRLPRYPRYPSRRLLPAWCWPVARPFYKIIETLNSRREQLGFAILEVGPLPVEFYESVRNHISSALKAALVHEQLSDAYNAVEQRVADRTAKLKLEIDARKRAQQAREALYRISEAAHTTERIEALYPIIHDIVSELMVADNFYIALISEETGDIHCPYFVDQKDPQPAPKPLGKGLTDWVLRHGEPLLMDSPTLTALKASGEVIGIGTPAIDWLGVPLRLGQEVIGALVVQTYEPTPRYTPSDRDLLAFVSTQIALAIKRVEADSERAQLLEMLQRSHIQLQTAVQVSKSALIYLNPDELIKQAATLIRERFGFYYVGIFLKDQLGEYAILRAGTGEPGQQMLQMGHRLPIDDTSMVGWCTRHGQARIAHDVGTETIRFANPWLPETRAEMALPLMSQKSGCIGALTIQSTDANDFSEGDIAVLQTMADHLAIALENARLHDQIRKHNIELEVKVAERTEELVAANKELASFSYSVSHDLRAPVRRINGFCQALLEDYGNVLDATGMEYLHRLQFSAHRMAQIIDDLLELARLSQDQLSCSEVNLSRMAREIIEELMAQEPQRKADIRIAPQMMAQADARMLRIALENLLSNAWKFTGKQSRCEITFEICDSDGDTVYCIRDNGVGFDMAYADKLFGVFQRLHEADEFEGVGVGLATVRRILHRHGGRIWAKSAPNQGASFYFTLGRKV